MSQKDLGPKKFQKKIFLVEIEKKNFFLQNKKLFNYRHLWGKKKNTFLELFIF